MRVFVEVLVCDLKKKSFGGQVLGGPLEYRNKTCFGKSKRIYQKLFYRRVFAMSLGLPI
jgi:hypothetical protein